MHRRLVILAPLALGACASVLPQQKYVAKVDWPLAPPPPSLVLANPAGPVLLVRDITAAPGLDAQGLQALQADGSLTVDYYNLWAVAPAGAVTQALAGWAQASGNFSAVVTPGSRLTPSVILEGELTELVADLSTGRARCVLTLVVIKAPKNFTAAALPLAQQRILGTAPLNGTDAPAQVTAERAALASALAQAVALLNKEAASL
jgi:cholesterol transport system auxiliary component